MSIKIHHSGLRNFAYQIYGSMGVEEDVARLVGDYQVDTNLYGLDSHGCVAIPRFVRDIRTGKIVPGAIPETVREEEATALINGHRSFGHVSAFEGVKTAIALGRKYGTGAVGITNCNHVGALWGYVKALVDAGMVGVMFCSGGPQGGSLAPYGATRPGLSANPIGFGVPGGEMPPLVMDMSTAVAAGGKVLLALQSGRKIPDDWVFDDQGKPTTDPNRFMTPQLDIIGAMRPFGGHKGYALAIFAEILGAILTGYGACYREDYVEGNGTFLIAIDIARFSDAARFRINVDDFFRSIKSCPCDEHTQEILIPGEIEMRTRVERERNGIPFSDGTWQTIVDTARELDVPLPPM